MVELEKFAKFVAWLYNVRAMRPKVFSSIAAELLLARPAADLKAYLGGLMIQKVGHVLILDGINVYGKILTRIDELAKQPTTRLTPETKTLLSAVVGQHPGWSKNGNQKYADLQKSVEKAKKHSEEVHSPAHGGGTNGEKARLRAEVSDLLIFWTAPGALETLPTAPPPVCRRMRGERVEGSDRGSAREEARDDGAARPQQPRRAGRLLDHSLQGHPSEHIYPPPARWGGRSGYLSGTPGEVSIFVARPTIPRG